MRIAAESVDTVSLGSERSGDRQFERLWNLHRDRTWRLIARLAGDVDAADDLTQEVSVRALQSFPGFRSDSAFSTWLYRIALNVVLRWREKRDYSSVSFDSESVRQAATQGASPESHAVNVALQRAVWNALETLPEEQRTSLILRVYEGLSYREIAGIMETPVGTVMSRLHAGRQKMREELKDYEM